ncbi:MAG: hypothetical protein Q7S52_01215, partial [bacterium]|nr:hypothetical protein [bacterium]
HVKKVITYRVIYPAHPFTVGLMGEKFIESYFIWGEEIELIADEKLKNAAVQDFSDARFLRMLTACALVAVRYRVLWNKNFFLNARLRTCASAYRDTTIPEQHRTRLFAKHKECADLAKDPFALDAHILLTLVQMAQDDGAHLLDTLHYLTNSKEAS